MTRCRRILAEAVIVLSFLTQYGALHHNRSLTFPAFLLMIVASLFLYQSFESLVPKTSAGIIGYFAGRIVFTVLIVYGHAVVYQALVSASIRQDGVPAYGIATGISSAYFKGRHTFSRHFTYYADGKALDSKVDFSYDLNRGDTLYLRYSRSNPALIEFDDNAANRRHGIVK